MFRILLSFIVFAHQICGETEIATDLSEATATFTLGLLKNSGPFENVFFSPASISACIGMVYAGSKGETKNELNKVVYGGLADSKIYEDIKNGTEKLSHLPTGYTFNVANRVYSTDSAELLDSFKQNVADNFKSDIIRTDFGQYEKARQEINGWVKEKTQQKISDLLPADSLDALTKIVLINALYFKGDWLHKFMTNKTKEEPFFSSANKQFNVSMMKAKTSEFHYAEHQGAKILGLPFKNETMFMYMILPEERFKLKEIEERLNGKQLLAMFSKAKPQNDLSVQIPKFKLQKELKLKTVLTKMNVTSLFSPGEADLSGMFGKTGLYVSGAFHQAVVEVNEEGSEAAAATGIVAATRMLSVGPTFVANHPFLFAIVHKETKAILFFGRFVNDK
jgi:serpin B